MFCVICLTASPFLIVILLSQLTCARTIVLASSRFLHHFRVRPGKSRIPQEGPLNDTRCTTHGTCIIKDMSETWSGFGTPNQQHHPCSFGHCTSRVWSGSTSTPSNVHQFVCFAAFTSPAMPGCIQRSMWDAKRTLLPVAKLMLPVL